MSDKIKVIVFAGSCLFTFAVGLFCGFVSRQDKTEYIYVPEYVTVAGEKNPDTDPVPLPAPPEYYYMISQNGIIYVYSANESGNLALMLEIDYVDFGALSENQKQKLKEGISFASMEDVAEFVQDLGT